MNLGNVNIDLLPLIHELSSRANINVYPVEFDGEEKYVVLYDDHRTLINVLFFARMKGILEDTPNLIYFDYHDDAALMWNVKRARRYKPSQFSQKEFERFWNYVEFHSAADDSDWLCNGMYFNLIRDAVCVGVESDSNIDFLNKFFRKRGKHHLYKIRHLNIEMDSRGCFMDRGSQRNEEYKHIRDIFKHNQEGEVNEILNVPYVLDFDLDCFSGSIGGVHKAWPEKAFWEHCYGDLDVRLLMRNTIRNSAFITICREPGYCGGLGEANKILSYLDRYFFEGQLQTLPIE